MPPWLDTGTHSFELTGQKYDPALDIAVAMQTLEKVMALTLLSTPAAQQHTVAQMVEVASLSTLAAVLTPESAISVLFQVANGFHPSNFQKSRRKLCKQSLSFYMSLSPSTMCALFQIVCQHSNACKVYTHPSNLPTLTEIRFLMICPCLPRNGTISLLYHILAILTSMKMSLQMWRQWMAQLWSSMESAIAASRWATKENMFTYGYLCRIHSERDEKVNLIWETICQVSVSRLRCRHHYDLKYWLHEIGRVPNTVCRKCGMVELTVVHAIGGVLNSPTL